MEIDSLDVFDAAVYGTPHQGTVNYVKEQFSRGWENLTDMGRSFFEEKRELVEQATSHDAFRKTEALARKFRHMWDTDDIKILDNISHLQQAKPAMQRWLMADPVARDLRNRNLIDGYSNTYDDWTPKDIGENHYDFRRATDGIFMEDDEGNGECVSYSESHVNDEDDLSFQQQADISASWATQREILKRRREDPTSPRNDRM
jgi:hypothetical protein